MTLPLSSAAVESGTDTKTPNDEKKPTFSQRILQWFVLYSRAILAEIVSTTMLIFFGCMGCVPLIGFDQHPPMYAAFSFGFVVLMLIQIFGHISGAHMNPAVTLASVIWGSLTVSLGIAYFIAQCLGSTLGYFLLQLIAPLDLAPDGICVTVPHVNLSALQGFFVEVALTASLAFVCCGCWDPVNKDKQDSVGLKFGVVIVGLSLVGGPLTGASMNPARSLGPAIITGIWRVHYIYWAGPFLGAGLATIIYKLLWLAKEEPVTSEEVPLNSV